MGTDGSTVLEPLWHGLPALDAAALSGSASCALPARYEAVKSARVFTHKTLRRWELNREFDDVALVVSELVTNALRHGLPASAPPEADPPVRLHLMRWSSRLVCAVRDPSGEAPHAAAQEKEFDEMVGFADCTAESGRGLWLVDSFSDCWGWHRLTGALPGKVVWAMFRFGPAV
ncbi:ATP-binding protein [Streptomyces armeniacus]|uniref:ATP-binding protein n=1 Tax=Streptomyces armeniacus TaxID=83291 RepID=A0A345XPN1_9ACTN|nr:ATP-binding protein [Streptomyces armeniacus]AXK33597.1 ATP-binding protein [Streptomyces armeniacus]